MSELIRCSIGTEPSQWLPALVLQSSILRRTTRPVEFTFSWTPEQGWSPFITDAPPLAQGTKFSAWRWIVPKFYGYEGHVIYLDADMVVLADVGELWDSPATWNHFIHFAAVKNATGIFGKNKIPELGKVQTSVMVLNCQACDWDAARLFRSVAAGRLKYSQLMQAAWRYPEQLIQELDPAWNRFGVLVEPTKLLHWSHVASQPWRNKSHPTAHVWQAELFAAIEAGHVAEDLLESSVSKGFVDPIYLKRWRVRAA